MNNHHKSEHVIQRMLAGASVRQMEIAITDIDLNGVGSHGRTPLMVAAAEGFLDAARLFVKHGASVHATGQYETTPLHEAAANGETAIASYLLSLGAKVDAITIQKVTPLMGAAAFGHVELVVLLLKSSADTTKTDCTGASAGDVAREKGEDATADLIDSWAKLKR